MISQSFQPVHIFQALTYCFFTVGRHVLGRLIQYNLNPETRIHTFGSHVSFSLNSLGRLVLGGICFLNRDFQTSLKRVGIYFADHEFFWEVMFWGKYGQPGPREACHGLKIPGHGRVQSRFSIFFVGYSNFLIQTFRSNQFIIWSTQKERSKLTSPMGNHF